MASRQTGRSGLRGHLAGSVSIAAMCFAVGTTQARAQNAPASGPSSSASGAIAEIVVTGSRVARPNNTSPTPVTTFSVEELQKASPSTISESLRTLPALQASTGPNRNTGSTGGGQTYLNLRGLGAQRTLFLVDGQRFVATNTTGSVDVNLVPSALISRVDIVTGGASAAYGSDAVSGVVNFVLNNKFEGLKGSVQYGQTDWNDNREFVASLAAGRSFANGRGHVVGSFEYYNNDGIKGDARAFARAGYQIIAVPGAAGTPASPSSILGSNVKLVTSNAGLILNGNGGSAAANASFRGITFNPDSSSRQFNFGTLTSTGTQVGGDGVDNGIIQQLSRPLNRKVFFLRSDYDLTDKISVYGEAVYGAVESDYINGQNNHNSTAVQTAFITIQPDNAYLPASIRNQMIASGVKTLTMTRWDTEGGPAHTLNQNYTTRLLGGFKADLGHSWKLDGYYEWGQNRNNDLIKNTDIVGNFNQATDAVVNPANGQVVCRSTLTAPTNGCVPFNPFGVGAASAAAAAYVVGTAPAYTTTNEQVFSTNISGEPFNTWAGPVSVATGFEYRRETANVTSDALSLVGGYKLGNQQPWSGKYDIKEGYFETVVPLAKDLMLARLLEFNGAVRETDYSNSGAVTTWKAGLSYKPWDDLRLRVTRSRDIRAPSLSELYSAGRQQVASGQDPFKGNASFANVSVSTTGNPNLTPEIADTWTYGFVYQPSWASGLVISADYYDIKIANAIGTPTQQYALNECYAGVSSLCSLIIRDATGALVSFKSSPVNYSQAATNGIDYDISYRVPASTWFKWWRGNLILHGLANWVEHNTTTLPGTPQQDIAGTILNTDPHWQFQISGTYTFGPLSATMIDRFIGAGVYDKLQPPNKLNLQQVNSVDYVDGQISYDLPQLGRGGQIYLNVRNLFNLGPPATPVPGNLAIGTNAALYDTYGRMWRLGVKFGF